MYYIDIMMRVKDIMTGIREKEGRMKFITLALGVFLSLFIFTPTIAFADWSQEFNENGYMDDTDAKQYLRGRNERGCQQLQLAFHLYGDFVQFNQP